MKNMLLRVWVPTVLLEWVAAIIKLFLCFILFSVKSVFIAYIVLDSKTFYIDPLSNSSHISGGPRWWPRCGKTQEGKTKQHHQRYMADSLSAAFVFLYLVSWVFDQSWLKNAVWEKTEKYAGMTYFHQNSLLPPVSCIGCICFP